MSEHQLRISHLTADVKNHKHLRIIENDSFKKKQQHKNRSIYLLSHPGFQPFTCNWKRNVEVTGISDRSSVTKLRIQLLPNTCSLLNTYFHTRRIQDRICDDCRWKGKGAVTLGGLNVPIHVLMQNHMQHFLQHGHLSQIFLVTIA